MIIKSYPKISIITPSFKQGEFLERTILSILNQDYQNMEYIIIDGASNDRSVEIIKKYENQLSYWISEPDAGQSDAINKGFQKATGVLVCWVNSDDILLPGAINQVADAFRRCRGADIITGNVLYIDERDFIIRCVRVPKMRWFFYRRNVGFFAAPAVFFSKSMYDKVGGLDINIHFSMDIDLWHKFRLANAKVYHVREYLGAFRVHSSSKTGPRIKGETKYFEHPETTIIRQKYLPGISKNSVITFRLLYKLWQVINLNYVKGWIDLKKWNNNKWMDVDINK